jgi:hypothetical protein
LDLSYKNNFIFNQIINLIGDDTREAISYKRFRRIADKNKDLGIEPLSEDIHILLRRIYTHRNWALHVPESLLSTLIEEEKIANKNELNLKSPIHLSYYDYFSGDLFMSLYEGVKKIGIDFIKSLYQVKKDYSILSGESHIEFKWDSYSLCDSDKIKNIGASYDIQFKNVK